MEKRKFLIAAFVFLFLCCLAARLAAYFIGTNYQKFYEGLLGRSSLPVDSAAPDFELIGVDGESMKLSQFSGKPTILTIGATWCPECKTEAPLLQELKEKYPGINILMVDVKEDLHTVIDFKIKNQITYPIALDPSGLVYQQYQVFAIPTLFLIDEDGRIVARIIERVNRESLNALLEGAGLIE